MNEHKRLQEALRAAAAALGAEPSDDQLDRLELLFAQLLRNELRDAAPPELGEIEPAFALRFDTETESS